MKKNKNKQNKKNKNKLVLSVFLAPAFMLTGF